MNGNYSSEKKKSPDAPVRDYKERFEFRLTVGENIICQRYFKINSFNPTCLKSFELANTIRYCGELIDRMLASKSRIYLDIVAPQVFDTVEEMNSYYENERHREEMKLGRGIVVRKSPVDYAWGDGKPVPCQSKFTDVDFASPLTQEDRVNYKFAFLVDEREVCSYVWEGVYPKYVRHSIDLSNKGGRNRRENDGRQSFDTYLDGKLVEGRSDMVWHLINYICEVCGYQRKSDYTTAERYGKKHYDNLDNFNDSFYTKHIEK